MSEDKYAALIAEHAERKRMLDHAQDGFNKMAIAWKDARKERDTYKAMAEQLSGMVDDLRDEFAKAALTGLLANPSHDPLEPFEWASDAYNIADAMMKARERE